jgi:Rieske Fe-S protein
MFSMASVGMVGGLAVGYGTLLAWAGRFLYSSGEGSKGWLFVTQVDSLAEGDSLEYVSPTGQPVVIARNAERGTTDDFVALSSVCPHLGCRVDWQSHLGRFFCPCHNGVFDPAGVATAGPPADVNPPQQLSKYPLMVENGLLFIEVSLEGVTAGTTVATVDAGSHGFDMSETSGGRLPG